MKVEDRFIVEMLSFFWVSFFRRESRNFLFFRRSYWRFGKFRNFVVVDVLRRWFVVRSSFFKDSVSSFVVFVEFNGFCLNCIRDCGVACMFGVWV